MKKFKKKLNNQGFTLVELIVVITILAILWTIAFISLQWYSAQARDSKRVSDISNIKKSLELFSLNTWKYPKPDSYNTVSYTWELIWYQWTVWEQVTKNLSRNLNKKPIDPLTQEEYTYSTINSQTEFEVLWLYENNLTSLFREFNSDLFPESYAANFKFAKVEGNFNWLYARTSNFYLPTPSIINWNVWWNVDFADDENLIKSQIITWWDNIPLTSTWGLNIKFSPYEWTITSESTDEEKMELVEAIQNAYSWTVLENNTVYADLLSRTSTWDITDFVDVVVLETAEYSTFSTGGWYNGWEWEQTSNYNCDETTKPVDNSHIEYVTWTPTEENQAYVQGASNCWYTCELWYEYRIWDNACILSECTWSIPSNATSNATSQSNWVSWNYNTTSWVCTFECDTNYEWNSWNGTCYSSLNWWTITNIPWYTIYTFTSWWMFTTDVPLEIEYLIVWWGWAWDNQASANFYWASWGWGWGWCKEWNMSISAWNYQVIVWNWALPWISTQGEESSFNGVSVSWWWYGWWATWWPGSDSWSGWWWAYITAIWDGYGRDWWPVFWIWDGWTWWAWKFVSLTKGTWGGWGWAVGNWSDWTNTSWWEWGAWYGSSISWTYKIYGKWGKWWTWGSSHDGLDGELNTWNGWGWAWRWEHMSPNGIWWKWGSWIVIIRYAN